MKTTTLSMKVPLQILTMKTTTVRTKAPLQIMSMKTTAVSLKVPLILFEQEDKDCENEGSTALGMVDACNSTNIHASMPTQGTYS